MNAVKESRNLLIVSLEPSSAYVTENDVVW